MSWEELGVAICNHFGKDQNGALMREFFHIHKRGSVDDYIEQFDT